MRKRAHFDVLLRVHRRADQLGRHFGSYETVVITIDWVAELKRDAALGAHG
jgi:hypothetical protein